MHPNTRVTVSEQIANIQTQTHTRTNTQTQEHGNTNTQTLHAHTHAYTHTCAFREEGDLILGITPLQNAVRRGSVEVVTLLVDFGADPLLMDRKCLSARSLAAQCKSKEMLALFDAKYVATQIHTGTQTPRSSQTRTQIRTGTQTQTQHTNTD